MCCRLARAIPIPKGCHSVSLMLFQWSSWRLVRGVFLSCGQPWADSPERIVDLPSFVHEGHPLACQPLAQTIFRPMHARKQVAVCSVERDSPGTLAVDIGCFIKRNIWSELIRSIHIYTWHIYIYITHIYIYTYMSTCRFCHAPVAGGYLLPEQSLLWSSGRSFCDLTCPTFLFESNLTQDCPIFCVFL